MDLAKFDSQLQSAILEQVAMSCEAVRNDYFSRLKHMVEMKVKAFETEYSNIAANEMTEKAQNLCSDFKKLEKNYSGAIEGRHFLEITAKSAQMRYDKLNVRLMNCGLRLQHLLQKVEQMDFHSIYEQAIQSRNKHQSVTSEIGEKVSQIKRLRGELDELKAKVDLAHADHAELGPTFDATKHKIQREMELIETGETRINEVRVAIAEKSSETADYRKQLEAVMQEEENLRIEIAKLGIDIRISSIEMEEPTDDEASQQEMQDKALTQPPSKMAKLSLQSSI